MKKFVCVLTAVAMLGALAACDQDNGGEYNEAEYHWLHDTYTVYYDGRVEYTGIYSEGDPQFQQEYMSDEDLSTVYAMACRFLSSHDETVNDYNSCDANSYSYVFYDANNVYHQLMVSDGVRGQMGDIASIIYSYFPDLAPSPTPAPASDDMLELSDEWEMRVTVVTMDAGDGYSSHVSYLVGSDATIERSSTDLQGGNTIIDFEDLCLVENFLRGVLSGEIVNPQSHYTPDGVLYNFVYTGEDGEAHTIYVTGVLDGEALEVYEALSEYFD